LHIGPAAPRRAIEKESCDGKSEKDGGHEAKERIDDDEEADDE